MLKKIFLFIVCALLLFVSWSAVLGMQAPLQKQMALIALADIEIEKGIYANAEPYLVQAVAYNTKQTFGALEKLKEVYFNLGSTKEYINVLKKQTSRADCPAEVYGEFARYYITQGKIADALTMLKLGIERTKDVELIDYYEEQRYAFTISRNAYEDVTAYLNNGIQVKMGEFWGLADSFGKLVIPCTYEQISTFDTVNKGCVIALQDDQSAVTLNMKNQIIAKFDSDVKQVGNLSQNIVPLQLENGKWIFSTSKLTFNKSEYDYIGTTANSAIAMKSEGKWGVISIKGDIIIPYDYDEIILDELGRCSAQNAVFAKKNGVILLIVDGTPKTDTYEDARPFTNDGWAAVKKDGKWGFINTAGEVKINYQFDDALSFVENLAAISDGKNWGYINQTGKIVIEPIFIQAKSFSGGNAPVLTERGWQFISLIEYKKGAGF